MVTIKSLPVQILRCAKKSRSGQEREDVSSLVRVFKPALPLRKHGAYYAPNKQRYDVKYNDSHNERGRQSAKLLRLVLCNGDGRSLGHNSTPRYPGWVRYPHIARTLFKLQRKIWKNFSAIPAITAAQQKNLSQFAEYGVNKFKIEGEITKKGEAEGKKTQQSVPCINRIIP
ncbi:hypothetical protein [Asticcacaulis taihuensis]|uniref:hypothetical protein n=1 Tax=Asticcacaulis taihuensis TaxID=260084 RepID=UPI0026F37BC6|nr:hypothetical protein [Asticcacaulis taihuensis]